MSISLEEALERVRAGDGTLKLTGPDGAEVEVRPEADDGDYGPAYLDAPYIPSPPGVRIPPENIRLSDPFPFTPIVITDDDLAPE